MTSQSQKNDRRRGGGVDRHPAFQRVKRGLQLDSSGQVQPTDYGHNWVNFLSVCVLELTSWIKTALGCLSMRHAHNNNNKKHKKKHRRDTQMTSTQPMNKDQWHTLGIKIKARCNRECRSLQKSLASGRLLENYQQWGGVVKWSYCYNPEFYYGPIPEHPEGFFIPLRVQPFTPKNTFYSLKRDIGIYFLLLLMLNL